MALWPRVKYMNTEPVEKESQVFSEGDPGGSSFYRSILAMKLHTLPQPPFTPIITFPSKLEKRINPVTRLRFLPDSVRTSLTISRQGQWVMSSTDPNMLCARLLLVYHMNPCFLRVCQLLQLRTLTVADCWVWFQPTQWGRSNSCPMPVLSISRELPLWSCLCSQLHKPLAVKAKLVYWQWK